MPVILAQVVVQAEGRSGTDAGAQRAVAQLVALQSEMKTDALLTPIDDGGDDVAAWNEWMATFPGGPDGLSWMTSPWLYAECCGFPYPSPCRATDPPLSLPHFRLSFSHAHVHASCLRWSALSFLQYPVRTPTYRLLLSI